MLGIAIFLVSLSMLFAASLVAFVVIRIKAQTWRPEGAGLPWAGLMISTLLVAGCSVTVQRALGAIRRGDQIGLRRNLLATVGFAVFYVIAQSFNWWRMAQDDLLYGTGNLYGFSFYMLTVLHALHVFGGIVSLVVVLELARRGKYSWAAHAGVRQNTIYWHFLGVVWCVLLAVLAVGG